MTDVLGDRFELGELAGAGAMGTVFRARDRTTGNTVAVKLLGHAGGTDASRFEREARLLAALRHHAIVRYVAHGQDRGKPWLAMEWLEGEDLAARLKRGPLSIEQAVALVTRVAEGLGLAHALGVVHRDIKPSNIFLEGGDLARAKVIDFGVARVDDGEDAPLTATGMMVGTPHFMSPEQARGLRECEPAADVYALACVLFTCVALRPPFVSDDMLSVLVRVVLEPPPRLSELVPGVDPRLDALCARMLAKLPAERPHDGTALAAELAALVDLTGTRSRPYAVRERAPALGGAEQRLLGLLLASSVRRAPAGTELRRAPAGTELLAPERSILQTARKALAPHGATTEALADGSTLVVLTGRGAATDLALRSARCAIALRSLVPDAPLAMVTGLGDASGTFPIGDVLDRALGLLDRATKAKTELAPTLVDPTTAALLDARFEVTTMADGSRALVRERAAEPVRTLLGRETPCVGRERELAVLEACYAECVGEPRSRPVVVTGGVGIGKTRVGYEFLRRIRARDDGAAIWIARGDPTSAGSPLGLLGQVVRRAAEMVDGEPLEVRQGKLRHLAEKRFGATDQAARVAEFLGDLAGAPFPDAGSVRLRAARADPMLMADQLRGAFLELLFAECDAQPVVIVLEDLHWGDRPTVAFLDAALAAAGERPLLVVAFGRPELFDLFPDLWALREVEVVRLGALGRKAAEKLVTSVLAGLDPARVTRIVERAAGNAFYLEELIRSAAEGPRDAVPETVLAMLQARLEALEPEARRLLRAGSVFGQSFWSGGVHALVGEGESAARVAEVLEALVARELVARRAASRFPGEQEHAFRHALVRDAAYATLTEEDRQLGHRLAAGWLERAGETDRLALADHFEQGGAAAAAAEAYLATAHQALEANDIATAIARADRAARVAATADLGDVLAAARGLEATALFWSGRFAEAAPRAAEAMALLGERGSAWADAANIAVLSNARLGRTDANIALASELAALLDAPSPEPALVAPASRAVVLLCAAGRFDIADALLASVERLPASAFDRHPAALVQREHARASRALFAGDIGGYLEGNEAVVARREAIGDVRLACSNKIAIGFACNQLGAYARAEATLRESLAAAERMTLAPLVASALNNLGVALAMQGKLQEAAAFETRAAEAFQAQGDRSLEGGSRIYLAEIHALAGNLDAAEAEALAALDLVEQAPSFRCHALATLAQIALERGDATAALAHARDADALLAQLESLEEGEPLVRLALARALEATGSPDAREAALTAKSALMARAAKIEDPTYRASFLANVPENAATLALADRLT